MPLPVNPNETTHQLNIACPLYNKQNRSCQQSSVPASRQRLLCQTDDHDACPLYLTYLLRHSRMKRCDNDWLDLR